MVAQHFSLSNAAGVQYVQVLITSASTPSYGDSAETNCGLGHVQLVGTAVASPEPGTLVLLGTALVNLLAYAWRSGIKRLTRSGGS